MVIISCFTGCKKDQKFNLFTLKQDIEFGRQLDSTILADPSYKVLDTVEYASAYNHVNRILNDILNSDDVRYKDKFPWTVRIIDDTVMNAFAAPGGYLYFYTELIHFLENEAEFAGVMAHEVAHADRRHSTLTMTKVYTYSTLIDIILGKNSSKMAEIAAELAKGVGTLKFSREYEYEADQYSVRYLEDTEHNPLGIIGFFEKMMELQNGGSPPEFLSTHPTDENRITEIKQYWESIGKPMGDYFVERYLEFKNSLP